MRKVVFYSALFLVIGICGGQSVDTLSFDKAVWLVMRRSPEMVQAQMTLAQSQATYDAAAAAQKV